MTQHESDSSCPAPVAAKGQADSGIMVFSSTCELLYANQAAYQLLKRLNQTENGHLTDGAFPDSIADLLDEFLMSVGTSATNSDREEPRTRRLLVGQPEPLVLQVFGVSNKRNGAHSCIVLTIREDLHASQS